jgi:hypothetical protein
LISENEFQWKQTVQISGKISGLTWMTHRSSLLISISFPMRWGLDRPLRNKAAKALIELRFFDTDF